MRRYIINSVTVGLNKPKDTIGIITVGIFHCSFEIEGYDKIIFSRNPIVNYLDNKLNGYKMLTFKSGNYTLDITETYTLLKNGVMISAMLSSPEMNDYKSYFGTRPV